MSQTTKLVLGIAIAGMVLASGYLYWKNTQEIQEKANLNEVTTLPSGTKTTNTALDSDIRAIDTQIKSVGTDNADVSASVSNVQSQ